MSDVISWISAIFCDNCRYVSAQKTMKSPLQIITQQNWINNFGNQNKPFDVIQLIINVHLAVLSSLVCGFSSFSDLIATQFIRKCSLTSLSCVGAKISCWVGYGGVAVSLTPTLYVHALPKVACFTRFHYCTMPAPFTPTLFDSAFRKGCV